MISFITAIVCLLHTLVLITAFNRARVGLKRRIRRSPPNTEDSSSFFLGPRASLDDVWFYAHGDLEVWIQQQIPLLLQTTSQHTGLNATFTNDDKPPRRMPQ
ncbi:Hypothetical predicted protein [Mytilus galloprovincialis]|uniref:Uncharacterized protein n=1 Tax=Mytilus galloprovincialis TaxID=29158 RepID=A0A8B6BU08_MYTGA|nr:Hypothetical predicted protein [Mytilus galloprovincialis]